MKDLPVRFNLGSSEERMDILKILLETAKAEKDLERLQEVIRASTVLNKSEEV